MVVVLDLRTSLAARHAVSIPSVPVVLSSFRRKPESRDVASNPCAAEKRREQGVIPAMSTATTWKGTACRARPGGMRADMRKFNR